MATGHDGIILGGIAGRRPVQLRPSMDDMGQFSLKQSFLEIASNKAKLKELWLHGREHDWRVMVRQHVYRAA